MQLPLHIISDTHFRPVDTPAERERRKHMVSYLDTVRSRGGTLIIGGDFFDFWFEYRHSILNRYMDILTALTEVNRAGVNIHFLYGNHDYWDFGFFTRTFGAIVHEEDLLLDWQKTQLRFTHGDGLLVNDRGYRLLKRVIRSPLCISLFRLLHPDLGCAIAQMVSKSSRAAQANNAYYGIIRSEISQWARTRWHMGEKVVLVGHYHQTGIETENDCKIIWLGDWINHMTVTEFDGQNWQQYDWANK